MYAFFLFESLQEHLFEFRKILFENQVCLLRTETGQAGFILIDSRLGYL